MKAGIMNERLVKAASVRLGERPTQVGLGKAASATRGLRAVPQSSDSDMSLWCTGHDLVCRCTQPQGRRTRVRRRVQPRCLGSHPQSGTIALHAYGCRWSRVNDLGSDYAKQSGRGIVSWPVPESAPSGKWTFSVLCVKRRHATRTRTAITLVNHGGGTGELLQHLGKGGGKGGGGQSCEPG
jgi:hypothetical protein